MHRLRSPQEVARRCVRRVVTRARRSADGRCVADGRAGEGPRYQRRLRPVPRRRRVPRRCFPCRCIRRAHPYPPGDPSAMVAVRSTALSTRRRGRQKAWSVHVQAPCSAFWCAWPRSSVPAAPGGKRLPREINAGAPPPRLGLRGQPRCSGGSTHPRRGQLKRSVITSRFQQSWQGSTNESRLKRSLTCSLA